ncbi:hypothetical protein L6452_05320 [Arctium lappa]|uniref:Uncharacterized protein n=1 Tax=Arctium lappa TaxID=4217 RepID=A0ACB9EG28_ARCLA|nr:hypothetical protein L6452_05320 [Arctium lappa]
MDDEAISDAWERFKELLRKCPHHGMSTVFNSKTFYNGLNPMAKQMIYATAGGAFTANASYAKFLKDILSKKKKLTEYETIALTEGCNALLTNRIPPKLKDLGSFTIPCLIGGKDIGKALCDLGASINLMPLSVFNNLGIGEAKPTTVTLQLADKTIGYPKGKIKDVLVKVDKFIFLADFIILDFEADNDIPIILGRPFLATRRTLIDVQKGELTIRLQDRKEAGKLKKEDVEEFALREEEIVPVNVATFELLENNEQKPFTPSIVSPPDLELKQLPSRLKNAFLGEEGKSHVIISSTLDLHQEKKLVDTLKLHTKPLGQTIADQFVMNMIQDWFTQNNRYMNGLIDQRREFMDNVKMRKTKLVDKGKKKVRTVVEELKADLEAKANNKIRKLGKKSKDLKKENEELKVEHSRFKAEADVADATTFTGSFEDTHPTPLE